MPASESLTDPHMGSTVLCTEVYVFCTAGYCIYLFRGFVAPSTWYDCRDLSLSGTRRGLLENKTVLVCMFTQELASSVTVGRVSSFVTHALTDLLNNRSDCESLMVWVGKACMC